MVNSNLDEWFRKVREKYASQMQCGKGCTACCHGLFDISVADAVEVAKGFRQLPPEVRRRVSSRAAPLHDFICEAAPGLPAPALFAENDPRIDAVVNDADSPPCPLLGDAGECLIYESRPLSCRLEGAPMVDVHDGSFGDWCELNFQDGIPDAAKPDFELDYDRVNSEEESRSAQAAGRAGLSDHRAVTFIASVIAEYESCWKRFDG